MSVAGRRWKQTKLSRTIEQGQRDPDACWPFQGAIRPDGYGDVYRAGRIMLAHRAAYELLVGPVPTGMTLDHRCRNRACVNPRHLEPVTLCENTRRGIGPSGLNARKERCARGHPLVPRRSDTTERHCPLCRRTYDRARHLRLRTHCTHGHPLTGDNLVPGIRIRRCKACTDAGRFLGRHAARLAPQRTK